MIEETRLPESKRDGGQVSQSLKSLSPLLERRGD